MRKYLSEGRIPGAPLVQFHRMGGNSRPARTALLTPPQKLARISTRRATGSKILTRLSRSILPYCPDESPNATPGTSALFVILFYVYPLKFLFSLLVYQFLLGDHHIQITQHHTPELMIVCGFGFAAPIVRPKRRNETYFFLD
jgi:hypothetical protein